MLDERNCGLIAMNFMKMFMQVLRPLVSVVGMLTSKHGLCISKSDAHATCEQQECGDYLETQYLSLYFGN